MSTRSQRATLAIALMPIALVHPAAAQPAAQQSDSTSCRQFVQEFYDWYVPYTHRDDLKGPADYIPVQRRADLFSRDLLQALKTDLKAQAKAKGEVVGLDFDPFVNSQDPADRYELRTAERHGGKCSVEVWAVQQANMEKVVSPSVIVELAFEKTFWRFSNFHYPDSKTDLKKVLELLRLGRQHQ
jgi:hypothetical protein